MKIIRQIRVIHQEATEKFGRLAEEVRETLKPKIEDNNWFFLSRVKQLESFALKVETGRVADPANLEDFFACTIVVPTTHQIDEAEQLVLALYDDHSRRPPKDAVTHKRSSSFEFDDLRLYVRQRPSASGKNEDLVGLIFEVQIKTILQHAWGVATHDLIYKANTVSWPLERVAFQVKAMLEHAEISIAEADRLSDARAVAKQDERTNDTRRTIEHVKSFWPQDRLPGNIKLLAEIIIELLKSCGLSTDKLIPILVGEKNRIGLLPTDLSPYAFTLQALAHSSTVDFRDKFTKHRKLKIVIHAGMELPAWMLETHDRIINII